MSVLQSQPCLTPLERLLLETAVGDHLPIGRIEKLCTAVERALVSGKGPTVDAGIVSWARTKAAMLEAAQRPEEDGDTEPCPDTDPRLPLLAESLQDAVAQCENAASLAQHLDVGVGATSIVRQRLIRLVDDAIAAGRAVRWMSRWAADAEGGSDDERVAALHIQHVLEEWGEQAQTRILALAGVLPEGRMG